MSVAAYMRAVGLGYELQSVIDSRLVLELAKVNADQGRLGGLLKMWLVSDKRLAGIEEEQLHRTIRVVLDRIGETQAALLELAKRAGVLFEPLKKARADDRQAHSNELGEEEQLRRAGEIHHQQPGNQ